MARAMLLLLLTAALLGAVQAAKHKFEPQEKVTLWANKGARMEGAWRAPGGRPVP